MKPFDLFFQSIVAGGGFALGALAVIQTLKSLRSLSFALTPRKWHSQHCHCERCMLAESEKIYPDEL